MTWMASLFLVSVALLAVDMTTGFGFFLRRFMPWLRAAAFVAGGVLSLLALVQGLRPPVVQDYPVYLEGLPANLDGTVIVALSDLHLGTVLGEQWLAARVEQVQTERPDVVVLLGDVFEGHGAPRQELLATLRQLSAPLGVWGVLGNHESYIARSNNTALFEEAGVRLLRNSAVELRSGLVLSGVDDLSSSRDIALAENFLTTALATRPSGATILLSHAPVAAELAAAQGVNLMLSGHTHGGQIWPFSYLVKQRFPLFEGAYKLGSMTLIVSRGTGTWGPRMRLWRPAEILRLTLHTASRS
jgi:predicted MPP superfamily phosphohydrolase